MSILNGYDLISNEEFVKIQKSLRKKITMDSYKKQELWDEIVTHDGEITPLAYALYDYKISCAEALKELFFDPLEKGINDIQKRILKTIFSVKDRLMKERAFLKYVYYSSNNYTVKEYAHWKMIFSQIAYNGYVRRNAQYVKDIIKIPSILEEVVDLESDELHIPIRSILERLESNDDMEQLINIRLLQLEELNDLSKESKECVK